ncbi:hypothetical protein J5N97_022848 [Dioscorea zingiberensis]|uniref:Uncharacterized protein n=1 Tax=Dioscorea zingiberensis TaxID=325984 RepID=A0A9D5CBC1_9LILI|nr:hypothetical protein J5N97_022848 [Dioscorea zingiberensis]
MQHQSQSFSWHPTSNEKRSFTLRIKKKDKPPILLAYFDHIMESAAEIRHKNKDRLLYTNSRGGSMESRGTRRVIGIMAQKIYLLLILKLVKRLPLFGWSLFQFESSVTLWKFGLPGIHHHANFVFLAPNTTKDGAGKHSSLPQPEDCSNIVDELPSPTFAVDDLTYGLEDQ